MALLEIKKDVSPGELRWFAGLWFPLFCAIIGGLAWFRFEVPLVAYGVGIAALAVAAVGLSKPLWVRPIFLGWMYAAFPIGWVVSHTILLIVFYGVITPIGLLMRALGRDPMHRKFDPDAKTYWIRREGKSDVKRYFRQF